MTFIYYGLTLLLLVLFDFVWLSTMGGFYKQHLEGVWNKTFDIKPAIIFYLIYASAIFWLVIFPTLKQSEQNLLVIFLSGCLLGLASYGAYDLTNQATIKDWPILVTMVDLLWGTLMTGLVALIGTWLGKFL